MGSGASKDEGGGGGAAPPPAAAPSTAGGGATPEPDSRLPYTNYRELYTLKNYWKTVKRNADTCSKSMLHKYLTTNVDNMPKYSKLKGLDISDAGIMDAKPFEITSMAYLNVFDEVIGKVEESPADCSDACNRLAAVGKMHKKVNGIDSGCFQMMEEPFLHMVGTVLEDRYNDKAETLFRKFFQFCLKYLVEGYNGA